MSRRRLVLLALVVACKNRAPQTQTSHLAAQGQPPCARSRVGAVTDRSVGLVRIGDAVSSIPAACRIVRNGTKPDDEANPQRTISVEVAGDTVDAVIEQGKVRQLRLDGSRLLTVDSLGVGKKLGDVRRVGHVQGLQGEGGSVVATVDAHCGLSFRLAYDLSPRDLRQSWTEQQMSIVPDSARIDQVLVRGCADR